MSYCVHCGVELERSEKCCPLCHVEVINPLQPYDEQAARPYPRLLDPINERINRRFVGTLISIILAFPAFLCVAINFSMTGRLTWSLYVCGALALVWSWSVPYFLLRRRTLNRIFLPGVLALLAFLLLIAWLGQDLSWYLPLAMPLVLLPAILVYLNVFLILRRLIRGFAIPASILFSAGLLTVGIELVLAWHKGGLTAPFWSFFALIPCLAAALVCLSIARRQAILDEIKRRLHL